MCMPFLYDGRAENKGSVKGRPCSAFLCRVESLLFVFVLEFRELSSDDEVLFRVQGVQDKECTCNVTLRRVRATIVAVEKAELLHSECVFVALYPACSTHAPYCQMWPARLYNIFPLYLINGTIFGGKNLLNINCSVQLLGETFLILSTERDMIKNVYWSSCEILVRRVIL